MSPGPPRSRCAPRRRPERVGSAHGVRVVVAAVGRVKTPHFRAACAEYEGRLERALPGVTFEVLEVKDADRTGGSAARWKAQEGVALLGCMPPGARLVALDERGTPRTSRAFAEWLGRQRDTAVPAVCFLLGGPDGLDAPLRERAHEVLSFGPATLPHELARVVLLEQLYRATSILTGGPYHRD